YDVTDLRRTATEVLSGQPATGTGAVILFLPQELSPDAAELVAALAQTGELTVIAGWTGVPRADAAVARTLERLGGASVQPGVTAPLASVVRHASDADDEVRVVVREVLTALRTTP